MLLNKYFNNNTLTLLLKECAINYIITKTHNEKYNFHKTDSPHNKLYTEFIKLYKNMYKSYKNKKIYKFIINNKSIFEEKPKNNKNDIENISFFNFKIIEINNLKHNEKIYKKQTIKDIILCNRIIEDNEIECNNCKKLYPLEEIDKHIKECTLE